MDKQQFIQELRSNRIIKGNRPAFVYLRKKVGNIYKGKTANFILSIRGNELFLQRVTFFKGLRPKEDITLNLNDFVNFRFISYNMFFSSLCLYNKDRNYYEINYDTNRSDSYQTEVNMNDIVKRIKEAGLDELVYDSEEENEESND